ncbi:FtsX-like permease family protein [Psychromonas sp. 14N.309.X.WAT.B.A12]|uniref:ABC transporter permease n=1 Tax=Psychromonas sp. 14N.309.X.WAT.B.A12 TaxID=2998322 RepID=UPI0025B20C2D|nr:FtsX-like permease family protein [Psychromonas sp. 14N.309.X.WAT.B.A12]MDN2664957.1 FtsX-like permease family protein [Psychromonas sp. 14N.309.X.WAT.B.A12]
MKTNKMIISWSWREIWSGQLWPVMVALTLIIACVVALSTLALRVEKVMTNQGRDLLAADLVLRSSNPIPELLVEKAQDAGLTISSQSRFQTMAFSDEKLQLVTVKSVESSYPLRGSLTLRDANQSAKNQVKAGELWLSPRLFSILESKVGDIIAIGDAELPITGVIEEEPELAYNPFNSIPNVFIHSSDLDKTGAIQIGSRVRYRLFINGDPTSLAAFQESYELQPGESWVDQNRESRAVRLMDKAKQYLSLTILMVILMAAVTLILTCLHYVRNRSETVSMLKSMGSSRAWLRTWLTTQVLIMFISAFVVGSTLGLLLEYLLRVPLADILPQELPNVGVQPFLFALGVALCIGLPALLIPLTRLLDAPAINVIQKQSVTYSKTSWWLLLLPFTALVVFYGGNKLVWMVLIGLLVLFVVLAGLSYGFLQLLSKLKWGAAFSLALSRISRSPKNSMMQLAALSGSLMLVALIWLVKSDLLGDWQQTLAPDAPNVFSINISPEQQQNYLQELDKSGLPHSDAFAIIRGRITKIKGQETNELAAYQDPEVRILKREVNFTWMDQLPIYNEVVAGDWTGEKTVSVEQEVAEELGLQIGDTMTFEVNSQPFTATVNSLRAVEWQSLKPNFVFIFSKDAVANLPSTWMVSFRAEEDQTPLVNELARAYPTVTLLDLRTMATKVQSLLRQISWSLTGLAALGVVAGILLIFTLLRLSLSERKREITLYRTLGASKKRISHTLWAEYGLLALSGGFVAAIAAEVILSALMIWGFELSPQWHPSMFIVLPVLAMIVVFVSLRSVIKSLMKPLR